MTPNTIQFYTEAQSTEVLRISKDGIWANPDVPPDEAANLVLKALDANIKFLVQQAVKDEREACARIADKQDGDEEGDADACIWSKAARHIAATIRARGETN